MPPQIIFLTQTALGYAAWGLLFVSYLLPKIKAMDRFSVLRAIATFHGFRFFGLIFILPGVVGPNLPSTFATFAAYGDFATGVLALLALVSVRVPSLFLSLVVAFNVVGTVDILVDYYHGTIFNLPQLAGQLGAGYAIPILYVPALMITHGIAFYVLTRPERHAAPAPA